MNYVNSDYLRSLTFYWPTGHPDNFDEDFLMAAWSTAAAPISTVPLHPVTLNSGRVPSKDLVETRFTCARLDVISWESAVDETERPEPYMRITSSFVWRLNKPQKGRKRNGVFRIDLSTAFTDQKHVRSLQVFCPCSVCSMPITASTVEYCWRVQVQVMIVEVFESLRWAPEVWFFEQKKGREGLQDRLNTTARLKTRR